MGMRAVHENIRKHRCDYCEFTSFASSALKRHILAIHEKRKPFECDKCSFKSSYKESLELHLANKHKDEGVPEHLKMKALNKKRMSMKGKEVCSICQKKFYTPSGYDHHMAMHNGLKRKF